ncbi:hypothetical protein Tco_1281277 [Tanacetum coccineum]
MQGTPVVTDVVELSQRMTEFETRVRRDTYKVYTRLDDKQSRRQLLAGRLKMLFRDRRAHAHTARLIETKARILQAQMTEFERQQGPAKGLAHPDAPEEAGSSS